MQKLIDRFSHLGCLLLLLASCRTNSVISNGVAVQEASGVTREGNDLIVVDDSSIGAYFRVSLRNLSGSVLDLHQAETQRVALPEGCLAIDLEGVDHLADGRLVFLSERMRSLLGLDGVIVEYDSLLAEFANRGLEGVACRALANRDSRVAVLWEGGYPDQGSVPWALRHGVGRTAMRPLIVVHDLKAGARRIQLKMKDALTHLELQVPEPPGNEPEAQRFRAPDLVWIRLKGTEQEWGFLVLISSQNSEESPKYQYHWLQRFDLSGKPVGEALDLANVLPANIQANNWEGLGWFQPGKTVVLVHEGSSTVSPRAAVLTLPESWQTVPPQGESL